MSITDVAVHGMVPLGMRPPRAFGMRRMPPPIAPSQPADSGWPQGQLSWRHVQLLLWRHAQLLLERLQSLALALKPGQAWTREAAVRALLYSEFRGTLMRVVVYLGALALLAMGSAEMLRSAPVATIEAAPRAEWIDVGKPFPAFALSMPELAEAGMNYGIRRHASGSGRKDIMTWGELSGAGPHLMVEVYRPGTEFTSFADAAREIAARTEGLVAAKAVTPADALDSKFGAVSLVEFAAAADGSRQCLGFVRAFNHPHLQIAGWYCTSGPELIERNVIACALDRLTLLAAGSDAKVGELFARAELRRNFCGQRSILLAATPKHGPGPAISPEMKLRGRFSAR